MHIYEFIYDIFLNFIYIVDRISPIPIPMQPWLR